MREIIQLPYDIFQAYIDTSIIFLNKKSSTEFTKFYKYDIRDYQDNIDFSMVNSFPKIEWLRYGKIFLNVSLLKIGEKVWFSNKNILLEKIAKINRGSLPPNDKEKSKIKTEYYNLKWFDNQIFRYKEDVVDEAYVNYNSLRENKNLEVFNGKRIFARQLMSRQFRMNLSLVDYDCAFKKNLYIIYDIKTNFISEFILAVLNSRLFSFTQVSFNTSLQRDDFPAFSLRDFKNFSIPNIALAEQHSFMEKANLMLSLNKELQEQSQKFQRTLEREFFDKGFKPLAKNEVKPLAKNEVKPLANPANSLPKKLQDWYLLSYGDFIKELEKKKVKLSLSQKAEWEDYFLQESKKALELKNNIDTTDKEIDAMVYELYGLTEEEISIVENS